MAFALKYTHTFQQVTNYSSEEWVINIYQEGFVGSDTEFKVARGSIDLSRGGDLLENVQGTKLTFAMLNFTEGEFIEFRDAPFGEYRVDLIRDPSVVNQTFFSGYNQPEIYTEQYTDPEAGGYESRVEFTCGLNNLKYRRFDLSEIEVEETAKDANSTATVSASIDLPPTSTSLKFGIINQTGAHTNHVVTLQTSPDDAIWSDTTYTILGSGIETAYNITAAFVRLKVSTAEGAASTIDWKLTPEFQGQKALIETLRLCLNKLPTPLLVYDFLDIFEDSTNSTTLDSTLNQIFTDVGIYRENKDEGTEEQEAPFYCHQVIEAILKPFGAHIYHCGALWYIIRPQVMLNTDQYIRVFFPRVGDENTITIDLFDSITAGGGTVTVTGPQNPTTSTELILQSDAELSIVNPLNRIKLTYDQTNKNLENSNLIKDSCFSEYSSFHNGTSWEYVPTKWNVFGEAPSATYSPIIFANGKSWIQFTEQESSIFDANFYIIQENTGLTFSTTDQLLFGFEMRFTLTAIKSGTNINHDFKNFMALGAFIKYQILIKVGTFYLAGNTDDGFSWSTTAQNATFIVRNFPVNSTGSTIIDFTKEIVEYLPVMPLNGIADFTIQIFQSYSNIEFWDLINPDWDITITALRQTCFNAQYLIDEDALVNETIIYTEIIEDENIEEITTIHGDGSHAITLNSFRLASGAITDNWNRRGVTDNEEILNLLIKVLGELRGEYARNISGTLTGHFDVYQAVLINYEASNVTYYIKDYSLKPETNRWNVNLFELGAFTPTVALSTSDQSNGVVVAQIQDNVDVLPTNNNNTNQIVYTKSEYTNVNQEITNDFF